MFGLFGSSTPTESPPLNPSPEDRMPGSSQTPYQTDSLTKQSVAKSSGIALASSHRPSESSFEATGTPESTDTSKRWSVQLPHRLLVLPTTALALGIAFGMSRGGSRARLRFLAENAHRQPTTMQGWYFYTKSRNYRVALGALRQGARDGLKLGAATTLYVLISEGSAIARGRISETWDKSSMPGRQASANFEHYSGQMDRDIGSSEKEEEKWIFKESPIDGWEWFDGAAAGGLLGAVQGGISRLPAGLLLRAMTLGIILGTVDGFVRIAQHKVKLLKEESEGQVATSGDVDAGVEKQVVS